MAAARGLLQADFEQDRRGHLGERRPTAPGARFRDRGHLPRIDQTELRPVERHEPPATPERLPVLARGRARAQRAPHQLGEDSPTATAAGDSDQELSAREVPNN